MPFGCNMVDLETANVQLLTVECLGKILVKSAEGMLVLDNVSPLLPLKMELSNQEKHKKKLAYENKYINT